MERKPIGFNRERELPSVSMSENQSVACPIMCIQRADVDSTIITIVKGYMEERVRKCHRESLDRDLMIKIDKIFTKYFEQIA